MSADKLDFDILLYVALTEEFEALSEALVDDLKTEPDIVELEDLALQVFSVEVPSPALGKKIKLGIIPSGKMGITSAASVVSAVLVQSNCNYVVVLGIAGSLSNDLQPGDVIIPNIVTEFLANSAAVNDADTGQWKFETSGNPHITSPRLLKRFQLFKSTHKDCFEHWETDCASRYASVATTEIQLKMKEAGFAMRSEIKLFAGNDQKLASGSAVGKSEAFVDWLKSNVDRKLVAIEMESAGVYDAATIRPNPPRVLAIRGISDFADKRKKLIEDGTKGQFRTVAAKNAFSLLLRGIEAGFFKPEKDKNWDRIRLLTGEWLNQIHTTLPNGLKLPRTKETVALQRAYTEGFGGHVLGESGSGKSALLKELANGTAKEGSEVVWIKAEHFSELKKEYPNLAVILLNTHRPSGLLVIDALENCYTPNEIDSIGRFVAEITGSEEGKWKAFVSCQTPSWSRVSNHLLSSLGRHQVLAKRIECARLSKSDFNLVRASVPAIEKLARQPRLVRFLRLLKTLDLLLRNESSLDRPFIGEPDVVEWWWDEQVKGGKDFSGEEGIARALAKHLADALTSKASPDVVKRDHEAINSLIKKQILSRTNDGQIRFDHDLLADWARVMHLRSLGPDVLEFIREHSENPPWLRAVRIFSQHLLERASDHDRWQSIVDSCRVIPPEEKEPTSRDLQLLDTWLEGIAYCNEPSPLLDQNREQLLADNGWLLDRLLRRLLHNATVPDPVVQKQIQQFDPDAADNVARHYRLPIVSLWQPFVSFLIANPEEATEFLPVTLAELAVMWGQLEEYLGIHWRPFAEIILLNGEKELKREVAGAYCHDRGVGSLGSNNNSRVKIYSAAIRAASQNPDRAATLALKAAGRKEWDENDLEALANDGWRGKWHEGPFSGNRGSYVIHPVEAWPEGPRRSISRDFYQAWFEGNESIPLFRKFPDIACEVTLAFLIEWPKREIRIPSKVIGIDRHGFRFEPAHLKSAFWTEGPFIRYLRCDWRPSVELVVRLVNFATDRYEEWWTLSPRVKPITINTPEGKRVWKGNHQVFAWNRYHMNTPKVITCALMALEKWFDERIEADESVTNAIELMFRKGRSLALAGVLISIGKRHPALFTMALKPLLFVRELYNLDFTAVQQYNGLGTWSLGDGEFISKMKREWDNLSGRKTWLKDECRNWMLTRPEFKTIFIEVSSSFSQAAGMLSEETAERDNLILLAVELNPKLWTRRELKDGRIEFFNEKLSELRDVEGEKDNRLNLALLHVPRQCAKLLKERPKLGDTDFLALWDQLQDQEISERAEKLAKEDLDAADLLDPCHARAGMIAVLVCLGEKWARQDPSRFDYLDEEARKILRDPPDTLAFTPEDNHDDYEGFLARVAVRRWAANPDESEWRGAVGSFVTSYRYRTVRQLFDEAFWCKDRLGAAYIELEALALSFAAVRQEANKTGYWRVREIENRPINTWSKKWLPKFARGKGPRWTYDWASVEIKESPINPGKSIRRITKVASAKKLRTWFKRKLGKFGIRKRDQVGFPLQRSSGELITMASRRQELHRKGYGLKMGVILAAFGHLPRLSDASDGSERFHWIVICRELLAAYQRTLPLTDSSDETEWHYDICSADQIIFKIVAARLFQCSAEEGREFWQSILKLPTAAHHHIEHFLRAVLLEAMRPDPPKIEQLAQIWILFADYLSAKESWTTTKSRDAEEVWKIILLFGTFFTSAELDPVVRKLANHYRDFVTRIKNDPYSQSTLAAFLTTEAAEPIFIDALEWLHKGWIKAGNFFWERGIERGSFERLLEFGWSNRFDDIRHAPKALAAFKTLTLNLAAHDSAVAIDIQNRIGGSDSK